MRLFGVQVPTLRLANVTVCLVLAASADAQEVAIHAAPLERDVSEHIVQVETRDTVPDVGVVVAPLARQSKSVVVIWIHGATVNFYSPSYLAIGKGLARRGFTVIIGNTRMHDLANVETYRDGKRIRGGTYWGIPSEQGRDIAAWIDYAEAQGFKHVILVGHSAGANAVREYQARERDPRVAGLVLASGDVRPDTRVPPPEWIAKAKQLVADEQPEEIVSGPFLSAATFLDIVNRPAQFKDFFGELSPDAGIAHIQCPVLVLLGTDGDVADAGDLQKIEASTQRLPTRPSRMTTHLVQGANHMYDGHESSVAQIISSWVTQTAIR